MAKPTVLKVVTAGDGGVGKTTLLHRYIEGTFLSDTRMTIGVEFFLKELMVKDKEVLLQLWDFGGQERFRFLLDKYAMGARGAFLMFDLTRPITFESIEHWLGIVRITNPELPVLLLGTKSDLLEGPETIDPNYIEDSCKKFNLFNYLKLSSKTGENVNASFDMLAEEIVRYTKEKEPEAFDRPY
jgi:small GTP-binding protein